MNNININQINERLTEQYGVEIQSSGSSNVIDVRPVDIQRGSGFVVRSTLGWRNVTVELVADNFAGNLIRIMGEADGQKKILFNSIASTTVTSNTELIMRVNGNNVNPLDSVTWPVNWTQFDLKLTRMPVVSEELSPLELQELIEELTGKLFGMVICLIPMEETAIDETSQGLPEGAISQIEVNRYERSALNREACIMIHGCTCKVCGFDFRKVYGELGQGYIHVHHVTPVSQLGPNYIVDPSKDLVPVCPNCHAMLHRRNPPLTVDELKKLVSSKSEFYY
jgi:5-methylcytosine-specific restriction protein A